MKGNSTTQPNLFVIQNSLRPGDVILTMGSELFSEGIRWATGSGFSHAILVISKIRWFESDDEGVGYSLPLATGTWHDAPGIHEWVDALPGAVDARVLRHPALEGRDPKAIEDAIDKIVAPWDGEDYSDYRRLMYPLDVKGRPRWWIRLALTYYQWKDRHRASGLFCSEVIARVYEALVGDHGFPDAALFIVHRRADLVSPGLLLGSRLRTVEGAVLRRDQLRDGHRIGAVDTTDRRWPTKMARSKRGIAEMTAQFEASVGQRKAEAERAIQVANARLEDLLDNSLRAAKELGTLRAAARLSELRDEMRVLAREAEKQKAAEAVDLEQTIRHGEAWLDLGLKVREARADAAEEASRLHPDALDQTDVSSSIAAEHAAIKADRERVARALVELKQGHGVSAPPALAILRVWKAIVGYVKSAWR